MSDKDVPQARRVVVLGTGGTIAGRASSAMDNIGYSAAEVNVADLVAGLAPEGVALSTEQIAQLDSKDMEFEVWRTLATRCTHWLSLPEVDGIVVTHGTDTLEETAYFLQSVLSPAKPVVLTCAMRPATALVPDGPQNLHDAVRIASGSADPCARGVTVVCAGKVHSALEVQKSHTYRLDAFDSGDAGPIGHMEEGVLRRVRAWPEGDPAAAAAYLQQATACAAEGWPHVEIVFSHAGADGGVVDALLHRHACGGAIGRLDGLVVAATGNGTLHRRLQEAVARAQAAGVEVLRATRCAQGRILPTPQATLRDAGALTPVKARIQLMLELMVAREPVVP